MDARTTIINVSLLATLSWPTAAILSWLHGAWDGGIHICANQHNHLLCRGCGPERISQTIFFASSSTASGHCPRVHDASETSSCMNKSEHHRDLSLFHSVSY